MPISLEDVEHVASLGKLELSPEEKIKLQKDLDKVIKYIDQLNKLDTKNVPVTSHVIPIHNVLREDKVLPSLLREKVLANAPKRKHGFFEVPKVIG